MITLAVVNLKGGTTKTTSSGYLLHGLAESGKNVLGVDADPQGSLVRWSEIAEWMIPVVGMPVANLHRQLPGVVGDELLGYRYDAVVIDTPPLEDHRSIVMGALRLATHVITPMAPTSIEHERLAAVTTALDDAADVRRDGRRPEFGILFTRTQPNAAATTTYRDLIKEDGHRVFRTTVGFRQRFAQAWGDQVTKARASAYGDALVEFGLLEREHAA